MFSNDLAGLVNQFLVTDYQYQLINIDIAIECHRSSSIANIINCILYARDISLACIVDNEDGNGNNSGGGGGGGGGESWYCCCSDRRVCLTVVYLIQQQEKSKIDPVQHLTMVRIMVRLWS